MDTGTNPLFLFYFSGPAAGRWQGPVVLQAETNVINE